MTRNLFIQITLFLAFSAAVNIVSAGQISVINPSAGSEITGIVSVSPQLSSTQGGSGLSTSNNLDLTNDTVHMSDKYIIYKYFFDRVSVENFTKDQLTITRSKLFEVLNNNNLEGDIKKLIEKQLGLVQQRLE